MLLAEIPLSIQLGGWSLCAFTVLGGLNQLFKFMDRFKDKPAPGDVRSEAHETFMPKKEFKDYAEWNETEHDKLFRKIGGVERGANDHLDRKLTELQKNADDGREKIHKRINRISIGVARLCGRMNVDMPGEEDEV